MKSDEFIREVDEELQQDKLKALWNMYGTYAIAGLVLIVAATAGTVGWQSYQASQLQSQGEQRAKAEAALLDGDYAAARELYAQIGRDYGGGPGELAAFGEASAYAQEDNYEAAASRLDMIGQQSTDPALSALAKLKSAQLRLEIDDPAALIEELQPLAAPGTPFSLSAREALAVAAIRGGELELAKETLASMIDDAFTSEAQRGRASEVLLAIGGTLPEPAGDTANEGDVQ